MCGRQSILSLHIATLQDNRKRSLKTPATSERQRRRRRYEERMDNFRPEMRKRVRKQTNKRVADHRRRAKERLQYDDDFEY